MMRDTHSVTFETHRSYLQGLAYRMLGSVSEAEDALQDAYLRWHAIEHNTIGNAKAYLARIVTRLCLDRLKAARRTREIYVGEWLPEPVVVDADYVEHQSEYIADDISFALMLALERLSPLERAAYILREIFDVEFSEVATALNRSEATCRQLVRRAREHIAEARPRFKVDKSENARIASAFFATLRTGDISALRDLLADAAIFHSDGGGRKAATLNPIHGPDRISRLLAGLAKKNLLRSPLWSKTVLINGAPGRLSIEQDGVLQSLALDIRSSKITAIYVTRNPDKLIHVRDLIPDTFEF
ncbi:MAG: sigma-70 family RNA polymerase sigma factor [Hyphomicrobiales bacterium]|nr:sigma-70 family RNA polymerase sigma factor [Hyphomicrobiales bacterium]